jgi:antitoxin component YwqK of YwqJK toxin-antitoxin module
LTFSFSLKGKNCDTLEKHYLPSGSLGYYEIKCGEKKVEYFFFNNGKLGYKKEYFGNKLLNVSYFDSLGGALDHGTLKNGNGTLLIYDFRFVNGIIWYNGISLIENEVTGLSYYKNGYKQQEIKFKNYPTDTSSIENYSNDTLNGNTYVFNSLNVRFLEKQYEKGQLISQKVINSPSTPTLILYDSLKNKFFCDGGFCNGHIITYHTDGFFQGQINQEIFFSNGSIDSLYCYYMSGKYPLFINKENYLNMRSVSLSYYANTDTLEGYMQRFITQKGNQSDLSGHYSFFQDIASADGKFYEYYKSGAISLEGYFKMGDRDGEWIFYNEKGEITKKQFWENGKLIKTE